MRILIAGGFGFIGGRLGRHLYQAGHQIVLGSRTASSPPDWLPQAEVVKTEWTDVRALEQLCTGVDVVIHAASMKAQECAADPVAALELNGVATARLVEAAVSAGTTRFVYLSTAHVYASPLVGTITEDSCPHNLHPYATSHLTGEYAALGASETGKIGSIVLRLSNAFGEPVHKDVNCWDLLVNDLCRQAVQTGRMVLRSSGLQQRDFLAMAEVCRLAEHLLTRDFRSSLNGVINVGAGRSQSVLEMAQFIRQRCKQALGFEPDLQRPESGANEKPEMLEYRLDRLAKIGLNPSVDHSLEIDRLLIFCDAAFNRNAILRA